MTEREHLLEAVLNELIKKHFFGKRLEWGYRNDVGLLDMDPELYIRLCQLIPDAVLHNAKDG